MQRNFITLPAVILPQSSRLTILRQLKTKVELKLFEIS